MSDYCESSKIGLSRGGKDTCSKAMSVLWAPIDYRSLEEELHAALAADELYKLQNDAKLRAVEQGVPTYEHFRQMVNAAHLKPLDRNDMKPKIGVQWNPVTDSIGYPIVSATSKKSQRVREDERNIKAKPLEACEDFLRCWKTTEDYSERFTYVWYLRHVLQTRIFRVEIPTFFLGDFMNTCLHYVSKVDDVTQIAELLSILSTCGRFDLAVCFMTKNEQATCKQLFQQLRLKGKSQDKSLGDAVASLAVKYRIELD
ncbi:PREDICTED: coiled-coil domain-containing protein 103-like [Dinoponera quadriceps]|uniref:Coiled-coil domain-containing protein 103-like n=1 Tax=Dinoponera quadriceps TaxID=609295 RepID=A0A6P3WQ44_DINQU|nr:PREDICTED: coiled-coil domain-containing protein 103-like [Dinoponera quadriceps]